MGDGIFVQKSLAIVQKVLHLIIAGDTAKAHLVLLRMFVVPSVQIVRALVLLSTTQVFDQCSAFLFRLLSTLHCVSSFSF